MTEDLLGQLRERLGEYVDLRHAGALLHWDQEVFMPPKGAEARGRQLATLSGLAHRFFTAPETGDLLKALEDRRDSLDPDAAKLVEVASYDYGRATRLPEAFVREFAEEQSKAYHVWVKARKESDFRQFEPNLARIVELNRRKADYMGYEGTPYNALLEDYERGVTAETIAPIFETLAREQRDLVQRITNASQRPRAPWLKRDWSEDAQWAFSIRILEDIGYDMEAGRQDRSVHPFTTAFDVNDVRITTRLAKDDPFSGLMGSLHEGGHALYEQGYSAKDWRTPLAGPVSLGIHESQSRMWENCVGRSLPFWERYAPVMREYFPEALEGVGAEQIYAAVNTVEPSLIRVEADECTYNLHIILRFEIERALIEGELAVADVPAAWNGKVSDFLGLETPDDARGCLQDIHWSHGAMGYFPTYALGNLYAAQILERILEELPGLWDHVRAGEFQPLLQWLRARIHQQGRRYTAAEMIAEVTGKPPESGPFLRYLAEKYTPLYGLR